MHPNPNFRRVASAKNLAFARERGFGVLIGAGAKGPLAAHIPFLLSDDGERAEFHLVRSNPLVDIVEAGAPLTLIVSGPDAYVSPDWYGLGPDQVPTWNYVAVHLSGYGRLVPAAALGAHLAAVSAHFEDRLPKTPWTMDKMSETARGRLMRMIVPAEMSVAAVDGTWKLNQNKPDAARAGALEGVAAHGVGSEAAEAIARLMQAEFELQ